MLTELRIENFRSFGKQVTAPLAPLTLVFGPNSGGKTSLLGALGVLAQSQGSLWARDPDLSQGLAWKGRFVDLGSFTSAVHHHNITATMRLGLSGEYSDDATPPISARIDWAIRYMSRANRAVVDAIQLESGGRTLDFQWRSGAKGIRDSSVPSANRGGNDYYVVSDSENPTAVYRSPSEVFPSPISESKTLYHWMNECLRAFPKPYRDPTYLGPLRQRPDRFTVFERGSTDTPGVDPSLTLLAEDEDLLDQVNEWLFRLGLHYTVHFDVMPFGRQGSVGEFLIMTLTDTRSGTQVSATDVGFGISQVLPIVISLVANKQSQILIEQPEVHLHPRLQASLGDLIVQSLQQGNQLFLETHSEHLMLRLMALVREGAIPPGNISTLYVLPGERGEASVRHLRLDVEGDFIDQWPGGFFDERQDLLGW